MFFTQHSAPVQKNKAARVHIEYRASDVLWLISKDVENIYLVLNGGISDLLSDLFTIPFLCLPRTVFFPGFLWSCFEGGVKG